MFSRQRRLPAQPPGTADPGRCAEGGRLEFWLHLSCSLRKAGAKGATPPLCVWESEGGGEGGATKSLHFKTLGQGGGDVRVRSHGDRSLSRGLDRADPTRKQVGLTSRDY